jgi:hypothetical protein
MASLDVLTNHDQRHQQQLNQVRDEQPERKCCRRIELQRTRDEKIPCQPHNRPYQHYEKEPHGADVIGDPASQPIQGTQAAEGFLIDIAEPFAMPPQFGYRERRLARLGNDGTHAINLSFRPYRRIRQCGADFRQLVGETYCRNVAGGKAFFECFIEQYVLMRMFGSGGPIREP